MLFRIKKLRNLLFVLFVLFSAGLASAAVEIYANIPGPNPSAENPGGMIANFYQFALMIGGVLAMGAIVYGGIKYTLAAGSPSAQGEGKEWIKQALYGLLLLVGAYLILNTINPNLTNLSLPTLETLPGAAITPVTGGTTPGGGTTPSGDCPISPLTPLTGKVLEMENGEKVLWSSGDSNVDKNLTKLKQEFNKLNNALKTVGSGVKAVETSVYRPLDYQKHLWEIWNRWIVQDLRNHNEPACATLQSQVYNEYTNHSLGSTVASPTTCAPHVKGTGIDITLMGFPYDGINIFMETNNIDLRWQGIAGDKWHFNLKNPPYTGCAS